MPRAGTHVGPYLISDGSGGKVKGYRVVRNSANGSFRLHVPKALAELVGPERRFTCELTDEGILYRYREGGEAVEMPPLPAWLTERSDDA